jgi:MraZ protein
MVEFLGVYEASVFDNKRIHLPVAVTQQLEKAGAKAVRAGILPRRKALVLFPEEAWPSGIQEILQRYPVLGSPEGLRSFMALSIPLTWQDQGRISLPDRLLRYADLRVGQLVVIVGVGDHFEIWNSDAYEEMRQRCEEVLQTTKPALPPAPLRGPDSHTPKKDKLHEKPEEEIPF